VFSELGLELVPEQGRWTRTVGNHNDIQLALLMKKFQTRIDQLEVDARERERENALLQLRVEQQAVDLRASLVTVATTVARNFNTRPNGLVASQEDRKEKGENKLGVVSKGESCQSPLKLNNTDGRQARTRASKDKFTAPAAVSASAASVDPELAELIQASLLSALSGNSWGSLHLAVARNPNEQKRRNSSSVEVIDSVTSDEEPLMLISRAKKHSPKHDEDDEVKSKYTCLGPWLWPLRRGTREVHHGQVREELQKSILTMGASASKVPRVKDVRIHGVANPKFLLLELQNSDKSEELITVWAKLDGDWMSCIARRMLKSELDEMAKGTFTG